MMRRASATSLTWWVVSKSQRAGSSLCGGLTSRPTTSVTAMVSGKPLVAVCRLGRRISTLPNFTDSSALRAARPGAAGSSTVIRPASSQASALANREVPSRQTAVLGRPHPLLHIGRLESETLVDVAFAVFDHRDAGCARFGQDAGAFRAAKPAAAVLRLERPLLVVSALAAVAHQKEIVDEAEHRAPMGVHRDHRMKRQAEAFLVHPQGRGVLNGKHVPAGDLGAGARPGRSRHLLDRHLGIVQKPGNPHLASAVAPSPRTLTPLPPCATSRSYKK